MKQYLLSRIFPLLTATLAVLLLFVTVSEAMVVALRGSAASDGAISEVAGVAIAGMGKQGDDRAVATAVRDSKGGNLRVSVWGIVKDEVVLWGENSAGPIDKVAITSLTPTRLATVTRASGGDARLIVWDFVNSLVQRKGYDSRTMSPTNSNVAITSLPNSRVVAAVLDALGDFRLLVWDVDVSGQPQYKASARWPKPISPDSEFAITSLGNSRVVTAARDADGNLLVIVWDVDASGKPQLKGHARAGAIAKGSLAITSLYGGVATAVLTATSKFLKVIRWEVDGNGQIERNGDASFSEEIEQVATPSNSFFVVTTAVAFEVFHLKVITWGVDATSSPPTGFSNTGSSSGGPIGIARFGLAATNWLENDKEETLVTAHRDGSEHLSILVWSIQLEAG